MIQNYILSLMQQLLRGRVCPLPIIQIMIKIASNVNVKMLYQLESILNFRVQYSIYLYIFSICKCEYLEYLSFSAKIQIYPKHHHQSCSCYGENISIQQISQKLIQGVFSAPYIRLLMVQVLTIDVFPRNKFVWLLKYTLYTFRNTFPRNIFVWLLKYTKYTFENLYTKYTFRNLNIGTNRIFSAQIGFSLSDYVRKTLQLIISGVPVAKIYCH